MNMRTASFRCHSNEDEMKAFFISHGYSLEITKNLRRIFTDTEDPSALSLSSPEKNQDNKTSTAFSSFQLYCGHIPCEVTERELFEAIQPHGRIHEMCIMMDATKRKHRGFAFIKFFNEADQQAVMTKIQGFEIRPGKQLKLNVYKANCSLYIANIPKSEDADNLRNEFGKHLDGITNVIVYRPVRTNYRLQEQNRGFCFLEFETHEAAWKAKRVIEMDPRKLFTNRIFVDWADTMDTPPDEIMQSVRILYIRNVHKTVTESQLTELFGAFGEIERVKRIKNFAFVHFRNRCDAINAMHALQNMSLCGEHLLITLAYPPLDKQKREDILRMRQERNSSREYSIRIRY